MANSGAPKRLRLKRRIKAKRPTPATLITTIHAFMVGVLVVGIVAAPTAVAGMSSEDLARWDQLNKQGRADGCFTSAELAGLKSFWEAREETAFNDRNYPKCSTGNSGGGSSGGNSIPTASKRPDSDPSFDPSALFAIAVGAIVVPMVVNAVLANAKAGSQSSQTRPARKKTKKPVVATPPDTGWGNYVGIQDTPGMRRAGDLVDGWGANESGWESQASGWEQVSQAADAPPTPDDPPVDLKVDWIDELTRENEAAKAMGKFVEDLGEYMLQGGRALADDAPMPEFHLEGKANEIVRAYGQEMNKIQEFVRSSFEFEDGDWVVELTDAVGERGTEALEWMERHGVRPPSLDDAVKGMTEEAEKAISKVWEAAQQKFTVEAPSPPSVEELLEYARGEARDAFKEIKKGYWAHMAVR